MLVLYNIPRVRSGRRPLMKELRLGAQYLRYTLKMDHKTLFAPLTIAFGYCTITKVTLVAKCLHVEIKVQTQKTKC